MLALFYLQRWSSGLSVTHVLYNVWQAVKSAAGDERESALSAQSASTVAMQVAMRRASFSLRGACDGAEDGVTPYSPCCCPHLCFHFCPSSPSRHLRAFYR